MTTDIQKCVNDKNKQLFGKGVCDALNSKFPVDNLNSRDTAHNLINSGNYLFKISNQLSGVKGALDALNVNNVGKKITDIQYINQNNSIKSLLKYNALLLVTLIIIILLTVGIMFASGKLC